MSVVSAITPFLSYTTTASAGISSAANTTIFTKVLPAGVWFIQGAVNITALSNMLASSITAGGVVRYAQTVVTGAALTLNTQPLSVLYNSDGIVAFTIVITATTAASTYSTTATTINCNSFSRVLA